MNERQNPSPYGSSIHDVNDNKIYHIGQLLMKQGRGQSDKDVWVRNYSLEGDRVEARMKQGRELCQEPGENTKEVGRKQDDGFKEEQEAPSGWGPKRSR